MSQHPSLRSSDKNKQHRSVLKRYERVKILKDKELWKDSDSVYGLPKVKILRFKIKKEKAAAAAEGTETAAAPIEGQAAQPSKAVPAKEAPKSQEAPGKKEAKK